MKTAVEKANELFIKFYVVELSNGTHLDKDAAIECALIVVDEIQGIKSVYHDEELYDYYEQVKHETFNQQEQ
jgi:hypothetical protein